MRVSARVLRTIDKLGGLDEYLLGEKEGRIKELGESGWWLRWAIMQTPGVRKRFREERKALGISESGGGIESVNQGFEAFEAVDLQEGASLLEETEAIPGMDDAFEVERGADLPVIKFRVGPGKHVMLTADGWRRTRPDPQRWVDQKKAKIAESFPDYVESRVELFKAMLDKQAARKGLFPLPEGQRQPLVKSARREFRAELEKKIDEIYAAREVSREQRQAQRDAARKQESSSQQRTSSSELPAGLEI